MKACLTLLILLFSITVHARPLNDSVGILVNQVAYNELAPKNGVVRSGRALSNGLDFQLVDSFTHKTVFSGSISPFGQVAEWRNHEWYGRFDFSAFQQQGWYRVTVNIDGKQYSSSIFEIGKNALTKTVVPAITRFFFHQRAASPEEMAADKKVRLYGSDSTVDLTGGWCDASGDVSKYFSHLAYTNFMNPQQIPMVDWSLIQAWEKLSVPGKETSIQKELSDEALYGADYLMRSLSPQGFFYMTVFTYFDKDPNARRVVGLLADSKTTSDYACAWREGGGMAVAALARISRWHRDGHFSSDEYLASAERAFAHLQQFSTSYADDGKDNIIDDYCALMAASELWLATGKARYQQEARQRALNLNGRLSPQGYFIADSASQRPFWHAADAGLPVIALVRYLDIEKEKSRRENVLGTIKKSLDYQLQITRGVANPFGYPRQHFFFRGKETEGFFIPHENESGWWWQGEDARLGSLAAAMICGGRLVYPASNAMRLSPEAEIYAMNLISWIMGCNPYNMCMMFGYGKNNVPYMAAMYGHGSGKGGISNGITGKESDGTGIEFKTEDNGNEWRWSEQWIPHSSYFLQAMTVLAAQ